MILECFAVWPSFPVMKHLIILALAAAGFAQSAVADVTIRFQEGAPKDRFLISTDCTLADVDLQIDLSPSTGNLIFDVTATGAGVEVFQPVEVQMGEVRLSLVQDGDQTLSLTIPMLRAGDDVIISADLDDVLDNSALGQIRVAGSELDGAQISIDMMGLRETESFEGGNNVVRFTHGCLS